MRIIIAILILFGVIVFHELGHFLLAKASGIIVLEFSLGMGPRIVSFKRGDTIYSWRAIPIGGSCQMLGEDEENSQKGSFNSAKVWKRILVVAAGPVFNFILGFVLALIIIFASGADPSFVTEVRPGSSAEAAGLLAGDEITSYNGGSVGNGRELYMLQQFDADPSQQITLTYLRDGKSHTVTYLPDTVERYMLGYYYSIDDNAPVIQEVMEGYPLQKAGLAAGDIITAIDGHEVKTSKELSDYFAGHPISKDEMEVTYLREGTEHTVRVQPKFTAEFDKGFDYNLDRQRQGFFSSIKYSAVEVKYWMHLTVKSVSSLFTGRFHISDLSGPVGIVTTIGDVYEEAKDEGAFNLAMTIMNLIILLSVNVGVVNLLPIPALDGCRIIFLIIEAIRRKPLNRRIEGMVHFVGLMALFGLMIYVAFNDVMRLL